MIPAEEEGFVSVPQRTRLLYPLSALLALGVWSGCTPQTAEAERADARPPQAQGAADPAKAPTSEAAARQQAQPPNDPAPAQGPAALALALDGPQDTLGHGQKEPQPALAAQAAPPESDRLASPPNDLFDHIQNLDTWFTDQARAGLYVQIDKPLYREGETIWARALGLSARDLKNSQRGDLTFELVSPRGAVVESKRVRQQGPSGHTDFALAKGIAGGEYTLRVTQQAQGRSPQIKGERKFIVSSYDPPKIHKKMEFVRKAYGAGDEVRATVSLRRTTGEPLKNHPVKVQLNLDGAQLPEQIFRTDGRGDVLVRMHLPKEIAVGDGLLTVLVDDGGITESISRRVPIVMKTLKLSFYPEGGHSVVGLPSRVYFDARNFLDKPADLEGEIYDDRDLVVAHFKSHHNGLGRFEFTPAEGRTYHARVTQPVGIEGRYALPAARAEGCTLMHFDDVDGQEEALRVAVRCSEAQPVYVVASVRDHLFDKAAVKVPEGAPAIVYLKNDRPDLAQAMGTARITVLDLEQNPRAERLIFRNRRRGLQVQVEPSRASYTPREEVTLKITTRNAAGEPVPASLALSVVDDTVISLADDKEGHILSQLLLEGELPGKVHEPKFYFDLTEEKSAVALDLLMGTRGWRSFDWRPALSPPRPQTIAYARGGARRPQKAPVGLGRQGLDELEAIPAPPPVRPAAAPKGKMAKKPTAPAPKAKMAKEVADLPPEPQLADRRAGPQGVLDDFLVAEDPAEDFEEGLAEALAEPQMERAAVEEKPAAKRAAAKKRARRAPKRRPRPNRPPRFDDFEIGGFAGRAPMPPQAPQPAYAPVRVFPAVTYTGGESEVRSDFRETIFWAPDVQTDDKGEATVRFFTSDAITAFRVFTEGVGSRGGSGVGEIGRSEQLFDSKLPFSLAAKVPLTVSAGDRFELPLILTNEQAHALPISLTASFGDLLQLDQNVHLGSPSLSPEQRASLYYPLTVRGVRGESKIQFAANAGGLTDAFTRTVRVEPRGFPTVKESAGQFKDVQTLHVNTAGATPGSLQARLSLYPSALSTLTGGLEGMIRKPHGCFEQASSTTYPNVMVLKFLQSQNGFSDVALVERTQGLIQEGYNRLVGYETKQHGYEWFGGSPPHEALTAYGLMEFLDMREVYEGVDLAMIERTTQLLHSRRDGQGGFLRNPKALDSFGRASETVTDAYIRWSLAQAGLEKRFPQEMAQQAKLTEETKDPYLLALGINTLQHQLEHAGLVKASRKRLAEMQDARGVFPGAKESITRSGARDLQIETTALALLALLPDESFAMQVKRASEWLVTQRTGGGGWGASQASILVLKALTAYSEKTQPSEKGGQILLFVNGERAQAQAYESTRSEPLVFTGFEHLLKVGDNEIELRHEGKGMMPFSLEVSYVVEEPQNDLGAVIQVGTALAEESLRMGENVRLTATVENLSDQGQPMTLARVGLPGGLEWQTWQLKELVEKDIIAFYETRPREVILYFRDMAPKQKREVPLDLVATIPGQYTGPASTAHLYYTDDKKTWAPGLQVQITR